MQVLQQYANVKHRDKLRCNAAFFMGLLRQVADSKAGQAQGPALASAKHSFADPSTVSPEARLKLAELYSQGVLDDALMNVHCMGLLAALPKPSQLGAVVTIAMEIGSAVNKQAFIKQILKSMQAANNAASGSKQSQQIASGTAGGKFVSNTGKIINPNGQS